MVTHFSKHIFSEPLRDHRITKRQLIAKQMDTETDEEDKNDNTRLRLCQLM